MSEHPILDASAYPWELPEAQALHQALADAIKTRNQIELWFQKLGGKNLDVSGGPYDLWKDALEKLANAGKIRALVETLEKDDSFAGLGPVLARVKAAKAAGVLSPVRPRWTWPFAVGGVLALTAVLVGWRVCSTPVVPVSTGGAGGAATSGTGGSAGTGGAKTSGAGGTATGAGGDAGAVLPPCPSAACAAGACSATISPSAHCQPAPVGSVWCGGACCSVPLCTVAGCASPAQPAGCPAPPPGFVRCSGTCRQVSTCRPGTHPRPANAQGSCRCCRAPWPVGEADRICPSCAD